MSVSLGWLLFRRQWRSALWLGTPTALLFLVGSTPLTPALVDHAERPFASRANGPWTQRSHDAPVYDAVLALGGGYYPSDHDWCGFALSDAASRLVTGMQLLRDGRATNLVGGGCLPLGGRGSVTLGKLQGWIQTLCPSNVSVTNLGICNNTHDEAIKFKLLQQRYNWGSIMLVTSALHMPRSVTLFRKQGIPVTPVACDFRVCGTPRPSFSIFPRQGNLNLLALYMHEKIGWAVYKLRDWI
jgi:uncharacterized SAM-binding protein YcdF (DUF218 family)